MSRVLSLPVLSWSDFQPATAENSKSLWYSAAVEQRPAVEEELVPDKSSTHSSHGTAVSSSHRLCDCSSVHWPLLRLRDEPMVLSGVPEAELPSEIPAGVPCWPCVCRSPVYSRGHERSWMKGSRPCSTATEWFECTSEFFGRPVPRLHAEAYRFSYRHCEHGPARRVREFLRTVMWDRQLVCRSQGEPAVRYSSVPLFR